MRPIFAMAGLAEAALAMALGEMILGMFFVICAALLAILYRSRAIAVSALVLAGLVGYIVQPWSAFTAVENQDPDWNGFLGQWQFMATAWISITIGVAVSALHTFVRRPRPAATIDPTAFAASPTTVSELRADVHASPSSPRVFAVLLGTAGCGWVLLASLSRAADMLPFFAGQLLLTIGYVWRVFGSPPLEIRRGLWIGSLAMHGFCLAYVGYCAVSMILRQSPFGPGPLEMIIVGWFAFAVAASSVALVVDRPNRA